MRLSRNAERTLSASRRTQHRAKDRRGHRTHPVGCDETRPLFSSGEERKTVSPAADESVSSGACPNRRVALNDSGGSLHSIVPPFPVARAPAGTAQRITSQSFQAFQGIIPMKSKTGCITLVQRAQSAKCPAFFGEPRPQPIAGLERPCDPRTG